MQNQTNSKNLVVGLMLGVIITASLGATLNHDQEIGRYQISAGDSSDAYVLDTATGQVWSRNPGFTKAAISFRKPKAE